MKTKTTTFRHIALVLACLTLCVGCFSTRMGTDFNFENANKLKVGETTEQEVIQLIGQPSGRMRNTDGTVVLSYMYSPGQTMGLLTGFDPNLKQKAKAGAALKMLNVLFDVNGKVKSFTGHDMQ